MKRKFFSDLLFVNVFVASAMLLASTSAFAFGGSSAKEKENEDHNLIYHPGIGFIGVHVGGDKQAEIQFKCSDRNASPDKYGFCVCDDGYVENSDQKCVPNQCLDFKPTECITDCDPITGTKTYATLCHNDEYYCNNEHECINPCGEGYNEECQICEPIEGRAEVTDIYDVCGQNRNYTCHAGECVNPCTTSPVSNCKTCTPDSGIAVCQECLRGFNLVDNTCVANTCLDWHNTRNPINGCLDEEIGECITPSETYYKCTECDRGYDLRNDFCEPIRCLANPTNLETNIEGCLSYQDCVIDSNSAHYCLACAPEYILTNGTCIVNPCYGWNNTTTPIEGCLDGHISECTPPNGSGTTYYKCSQCDSEYTLVGDICLPLTCSAYPGSGIADNVTYTGGYAGKASDGETDCNCKENEIYLDYRRECASVDPSGLSCRSNQDCASGEYCSITAYSGNKPNATSCEPLGDPTNDVMVLNASGNGTKHMIANTDALMNWDSALNWCQAFGGRPASLTDFGINACDSTGKSLEMCGSTDVGVISDQGWTPWYDEDTGTGYLPTVLDMYPELISSWSQLGNNNFWMNETYGRTCSGANCSDVDNPDIYAYSKYLLTPITGSVHGQRVSRSARVLCVVHPLCPEESDRDQCKDYTLSSEECVISDAPDAENRPCQTSEGFGNCQGGECIIDKCANKSCPECNSCDPDDGICKPNDALTCDGDFCQSGLCQTCFSGYFPMGNSCVACSEEGTYATFTRSCARCEGTLYPRQTFSNGSCGLTTCPSNRFHTSDGSCTNQCSDTATVVKTSTDFCHECSDGSASHTRFMGTDGNCYSCRYSNHVTATSSECGQCDAHYRMYSKLQGLCLRCPESGCPQCYPYTVQRGTSYFAGIDGHCYNCVGSSTTVIATQTECHYCGVHRTWTATSDGAGTCVLTGK